MALQLAVAQHPYEPQNPGDLALTQGERIEINPPTPELVAQFGAFGGGDGWICGTSLATGQQGIIPEAYVTMLPPEAAAAEAPPAAAAASVAPLEAEVAKPTAKKKMGFKAAATGFKAAAKMAKLASAAAGSAAAPVQEAGGAFDSGGGGASTVGGGSGEGSCARCSQGCFVYGPQHPQFSVVGHLDDWACDICSKDFVNPDKSMLGYQDLYACRTFEACDWIACGTSHLTRAR
eukprot:COSAG06_NODE_4651_length_4066_cov_20.345853_1_plen_234_part_00